MNNNAIAIRSIQHYLYCPHRWGLIEIGNVWAENYFVTKANLLHQRVHDPERQYVRKGRKIFTAVKVSNLKPEYNIFGVTDCIEAESDSEGVMLPGMDGKYHLTIVEYKPRMPKNKSYNQDDLMQVFAQKLCVDEIFGCDATGVLYYADVKKRVLLPLAENYNEYSLALKKVLQNMREYLEQGIIPPIKRGQNCNGCSLKDLCMPKIKIKNNFRTVLEEMDE